MSRRRTKGVDYLRVYPGLNDFSDALEAVPLEMVRHFTLLKEIDAKCTTTAPELAKAIGEFMEEGKQVSGREEKLHQIRRLIQDLMPCLEEKMHVAAMAADTMSRHIERVDADFQLIVDHEIPKHIQIDPDNPALSDEIRVEKPTASRSEARREAIAAKKAAAAAAAAATESQASRQSTPAGQSGTTGTATGRGRGKGRGGNGFGGPAANSALSTLANGNGYEKMNVKRRREEEEYDDDEPPLVVTSSRRRRNPPNKEEPVYCYCEQGSYGDMVGCDGPDCKREWFHLGCIGLSASPKGQWFCEECQAKLRTRR